jgi:PAS domain S-box-containing protein
MEDKRSIQLDSREALEKELATLRQQLEEANETIEAIRTGQIDAIVVQSEKGHHLYTLKTADHTYRVFIEKMTAGAVSLSPDGLILYCNSQFAQMVSLPLSQVIGTSFHEFVAASNQETYDRLFEQCWKEDQRGEVLLNGGDNQIPVQLSLAALELQEGISLSIIVTDLTGQKQVQLQLKENNEQLEKINRALESSNHDLQQFASIASHDLQEPLRKIQVFSNLMKNQADLTPQTRNYLNKIISSAGRMKALVTDILNYSTLSGRSDQSDCVDLAELVNSIVEDYDLLIQDKHAKIHIGELPCVDGNPPQLRQVFQNIISNALKFSRPGIPPVININATIIAEKSFDGAPVTDGAFCLINVQDNGIGFNEKYVSSVFALFERLNPKDKYEGTGIGLSIAKKIIDKHNGLITAIGSEGKGATFKIVLPVISDDRR